jgi:pimeloyl-ACP methyl ester carboxylesterase
MGSQLRDRNSGEIVWLDIPSILLKAVSLKNPVDELFQKLDFSNQNLEPAGILDSVVFFPPLFKQEQYGRMLTALEKMGYVIDPPSAPIGKPAAYTFTYDWRQDNRISAQKLGAAIEVWRKRHPGAEVWLMGHSNGGIVSRWYVEKEGGKDVVTRLFLIASPWDGAPKALDVMLNGPKIPLISAFNLFGVNNRIGNVIRSFPSFYQLIPYRDPFVQDSDHNPIDLFKNPTWLSGDKERALLQKGLEFNQELGLTLSPETYCFFGVHKDTTTRVRVQTLPGGGWKVLEWDRSEAGDGTVPQRSAFHPKADEKLPFTADHGNIYVATDFLNKLRLELVDKYSLGSLEREIVDTLHYRLVFNPSVEVAAPGQPVVVRLDVLDKVSGKPVKGVQASVQPILRQALTQTPAGRKPRKVSMKPSAEQAGRFEATLTAPQTPGYYSFQAIVQLEGEPDALVEELVLVDQPPSQ